VSEAKESTGFVEGLFDRAKAVPLEALVARLGIEMEVHGEELRGICPIPAHRGEKKSKTFYVKPSEQVFHCFGCKAGGNIVKFAQAYRELAPYESKTAALWIVETMASSDTTQENEQEGRTPIVAEPGSDEDEALFLALALAGEAIIRAIGKHADNPRPLAERLARWVVEVVKI
jgi:hypothetical protein